MISFLALFINDFKLTNEMPASLVSFLYKQVTNDIIITTIGGQILIL
ncbi:hypothetical protein [Candidatus Ichthyocystis sparus]|nr:hypothetical protein [Candidatus Ichthyocystis sparus]